MFKRLFHRIIVVKLIPTLTKHPYLIVLFGILYILIPVDLLPEALTGPLGYMDDLLALIFSMVLFNRFSQKKQSSPTSFTKPSERDPYTILGINKGASKDDITHAYRQKMALYHPDKVSHLGDELKKKAKEETLKIQDAYNTLIKKN